MQGITYTGKVQAVALLPKAEYKLVADCSSGPNGSGMVGSGQGQPDRLCRAQVRIAKAGWIYLGHTGHH